ncbi:putative pentatricopeptide repeat-containing protein [Capsicum annuum]|uniref:Pentatricopeptide repeat-containing protein n=1 Tax=Capsicum annuum TaxID=4072 RepID=A0A2G2Z0B7_CAPAN|nr:putative pentatricopeptide repeat-containing protein At3g15130 [Capsicum annuum]XP_047271120.1 putative pentatricopeptide repeat-containing protein At3g15130 [Capsicum annuum]XP_047271121.1 putative pentatricopeptide repeat-containing protein At3g15130 [Capsicum annuum]XP_047271122.1 putative pentatricopeptide repeat-containing protein At3g15130 [Capsicum annuum]XP_047271123.1 putative pentatricopeptide repeat-containing protein At3g15130 [Capsicum annuum]XP_047271124.1 putative pentatricop
MNERQKLAELLRNCSKILSLDVGKQVHGVILRMGYVFDLMICNDLIDMYGKCRRVELARSVFDKMPERNVVSWTALMCGYLQQGNAQESLLLFGRMLLSNVKPNEYTYSTNLKACGFVGVVENGRQIHGLCAKSGFGEYLVAGNSIIDMYSRCGKLGDAEKKFHEMPEKSLITWNVMIGGYAMGGFGDKSLFLFKQMQQGGEMPDEFTFASTLKACSCFKAVREGSQIHGFLITRGFRISSQKVIAGALIDLYVKSGNLFEAHKVFSQVEQKSVISWTTLTVGYAQAGKLTEAMDLFEQLRESSITLDGFVLSSMMGIFADFALVELGKQLHCCAVKIPAGLDISVLNSIMDMYIKCGLIEEAETLFDVVPQKNVISWTVMITGYGKYGLGGEAVELFKKMHMDSIEPDEVSYLALLTACSHSGLIPESEEYFLKLCNSNHLKPSVEHYACMVDILGRAGRLREAKAVIENMPVKQNVGIWQTLLGACRVHKNVEIGREVGEILLKLDGNNPVNYVMMSNIFADARLWEECEGLRGLVKTKGLRKEAGQSWVEIDKKMHFFYNRDETHPLTKSIHEFLYKMEKRMKDELGYTREVSFSLHDVEDETRDEGLRFHSEKLAIGLALLSGGDEFEGKPIYVFKNLRVCGDCHEYIKGLSKILTKTFLVRDANRFHKFENGTCSCKGYW